MEELWSYNADCEFIMQPLVLDLQRSHLLLQLDALLLPLDTQPLVLLWEQRLIVSPVDDSTDRSSVLIIKDLVIAVIAYSVLPKLILRFALYTRKVQSRANGQSKGKLTDRMGLSLSERKNGQK